MFSPSYALEYHETYSDLYRLYRLSGGALEVLLGRPTRSGDPFWPGAGGGTYKDGAPFSKWFRQIVRQHESALLGGVTFHSLMNAKVLATKFFRHSVATRLAREGFVSIASFLLDHSSEKMVRQVYADHDESHYDACDVALRFAEVARERRT